MNKPTETYTDEIRKYIEARGPEWRKIFDVLRGHRLSNMVYEEGDGYCLADLMTADGRSIEDGEMQMVDLADALTAALAVEAGTDVEELQDKIDGLTADLESAVNTAYFRGATEWTRLNYPEMYKVLHANHPVTTSPASSGVEGEAVAVLKALVETFGPRLYPADHAVSRARRLIETIASSASEASEGEKCPICAVAFQPDDLCGSDIEMGICHAACLEGSPVVDLETGEPSDGPISKFRFHEEAIAPASAFIVDCLRNYANVLQEGLIDGAGHYFPDDIYAAAAALVGGTHPAPTPAGEWRTMDSAPRDKTTIILALKSGHVTTGYWLDNSATLSPWQGWKTPAGPYLDKHAEAWQPLPASPAPQTEER